MKRVILLCCLAIWTASDAPELAAQAVSPAEDFAEHLGIFKGSGATDYPALFLSPFPATTPAPSTLYGITFSVSGNDQSMLGTFSSNAEQYVTYEWLQPDGSSMRYNGDGSLQLTVGVYDIWLSPMDGVISINGSSVLTEQSVSTASLHFANISIGAGATSAGSNAFSSGFSVSASGANASAFGKGTSAIGGEQTVIGRYNIPTASYNQPTDTLFIVGGGSDNANPSNAMTMRADGTLIVETRAIVGSSLNDASTMGENSLGVGRVVQPLADSSVAFGVQCGTFAPGAFCAGYYCNAGDGITAPYYIPGSNPPQEQHYSIGMTAFGAWTWAEHYGDFAVGGGSVAGGGTSFAGGDRSQASGYISIALGQLNLASGTGAVSIGSSNEAKGVYSTALGTGTKAKGHSQTVLGHYNVESGTEGGYQPDDNLLIVGNGEAGAPKNAMTLQHNGTLNVAGPIRVWPAGDIDMGGFKAGTQPNVGEDPDAEE